MSKEKVYRDVHGNVYDEVPEGFRVVKNFSTETTPDIDYTTPISRDPEYRDKSDISVAENAWNKLTKALELINPILPIKDIVSYTKNYNSDRYFKYPLGLFKLLTSNLLDRLSNGLSFFNLVSPSQYVGAAREVPTKGFSFRRFGNSVLNGNTGLFSEQYAQKHPYLTMLGNMGFDVFTSAPKAVIESGASLLKGVGRNITPPSSPALAVVDNGVFPVVSSVDNTSTALNLFGIYTIPSVRLAGNSFMAFEDSDLNSNHNINTDNLLNSLHEDVSETENFNLEEILNRLYAIPTPEDNLINSVVHSSSPVQGSLRPNLDIVDYLLNNGFYETGSQSGVFHRFDTPDIDINTPTQYILTNNGVSQINLSTLEDFRRVIEDPTIHIIDKNRADIINASPHIYKYHYGNTPFTRETLPGLDRQYLVDEYDKTHMSHFPDSGGYILDSNGYLVGHTVKGGRTYEQVMANEFDRVPHGASIGFNSNGANSTSSAPMFWLLLRRNLLNGTIARVYSPVNLPRNTLNYFGRAYRLNKRGRMTSVPGTEGQAFSIEHKPTLIGSKTILYTLPNGELKHFVKLPDGTYFGGEGLAPVHDISRAKPAYYHNGAIYDADTHLVIYSVDLPFLTPELFVEHFNAEYILPLAQEAKLKILPARLVKNPYGDIVIEQPSIAGIKYKSGGIIEQFKKKLKNEKDFNIYKRKQ